MMTFTFAIITYNHEKYIIEHLESIKYQIVKYGNSISCNLIVCDDNSTDSTIELINKWLNCNNTLFKSYDIFVSDCNKGIVSNFLHCLSMVKTNDFKLLAGDDLYSYIDVFSLYNTENNIIITPAQTITNGELDFVSIKMLHTFFVLLYSKNLSKRIKKELTFSTPWVAPSVFYKKELINEDVIEILKQYKWIEDKPLFYCFFTNPITKPELYTKPCVLYRIGSGISTQKKKKSNLEYELEAKKITRKYLWKSTFLPKPFNPYFYLKIMRRVFYIVLSHFPSSSIYLFLQNMNEERDKNSRYYSEIKTNSKCFLENNLLNEKQVL